MKTGDGLNIVLYCEYLKHHHWMTFASWYSLYKNLPDAKVFIYCKRNYTCLLPLFQWAVKLRIPFSYNFPKVYNLAISCDIMALRPWSGNNVSDVRSNEISTFINYKNGCGNFVLGDWINKNEPPFFSVGSLETINMSANEQKMFGFWKKILHVYREVG